MTIAYDAYGRLASYTPSGTPNTAMLYSGSDERVPVVITNTAAASINDMQADPFGRRFRTASGSQPRTSIALPGHIFDIADRHYNMYRDYDPVLSYNSYSGLH